MSIPALRTESFSHADFTAEIVLPASAEELIDASEFNEDERLPYWADLWPSARALARHLLERGRPSGPALELGSGVALPSLALLSRGVAVLATDWYQEALEFARENAHRNGLPPLETRLLDWRSPPPGLGAFPLVLAADVAYEMRNVDALARLLPRVTAPEGEVLLADPGRVYLGELTGAMEAAGWAVAVVERREEPSELGPAAPPSIITILSLRPPPGAA